METKTCNICNEEKQIGEFYVNHTYKDGRMKRCSSCHNKLKREAYQASKDKFLKR